VDLDLTDEQRMLAETVGDLLEKKYDSNIRLALLGSDVGWSRDMWRQYAELGLLGLPFAEQYGGFGGGAVEVMLVMEAFGRALILEPYLATVVLGGTALRLGGSEAQKSRVLPAIADGSMKLAFAHGERQARYDVTDVMTTARRNGAGWVLDGAKSVVLHGDCADKILVTARVSGNRRRGSATTASLCRAKTAATSTRWAWRQMPTARRSASATPSSSAVITPTIMAATGRTRRRSGKRSTPISGSGKPRPSPRGPRPA